MVWLPSVVHCSAVLFDPGGKLNDSPVGVTWELEAGTVMDSPEGPVWDMVWELLEPSVGFDPGSVSGRLPLDTGKPNDVLSPVPGLVSNPEGLGWIPVEAVDCPIDIGKLKEMFWVPVGKPVLPTPVGTLVELETGKLNERDPDPVGAGPVSV